MPYRALELTGIRTYHLGERRNLVTLADLIDPAAPAPPFENPELDEVADRIVAARRAGRPVIWMMGAHVIKCGLSRLLIDLMERGIVTHVATNGAGSIHDFELALIGETSEDVASSIEDGTFGMVEETSALMHQALREGARLGLGYGESIGRFIAQDERFRHREISVAYVAYRLGIPFTVHVTIGTDIIHQHPACDFGILGWASGQDFKIYCASVSELEGGVFLNFGSAVTGPEVFLKALSIARNLGYTVAHITTANFDLIPLGDYRSKVGMDDPAYYYRPRKNVVNRPTSLGGKGFHITGDHVQTIPNLHHRVVAALDRVPLPSQRVEPVDPIEALTRRSPAAAAQLRALLQRSPELTSAGPALAQAFLLIAHSLERGGTLFLAGNGGSMADALHISGELLKSYARPRPLPERIRQRLLAAPDGERLAASLEGGLRALVLGANPSLASAVDNDNLQRAMGLAQELYALARPGDVLLGISTSGNARNVCLAAQVARALNLRVIALTGERDSELGRLADVTIHAPGILTGRIQEQHVRIYHALCAMLEDHFFGSVGERR
ncbi:MAG: SIS domain-containing protein [Anaerolineae bacterium]|nr:SIS domain-containing protein [Anaerolineae bacterium]